MRLWWLAGPVCMLLLLLTLGCTPKSSRAAPGVLIPSPTREYADLEAGSRLKIIAPVTKSGAYLAVTEAVESKGNVLTLKASDDLIGYETAIWTIDARPGGGVSIRLASAEMTKDGKPAPIPMPVRAVVHVPRYARFLRVFYLTRKSASDHDMAIAGVGRADQLEPLTRALREDPNAACFNRPHERLYCEWIPAGMAVRPEVPKTENGVTRWVDRF